MMGREVCTRLFETLLFMLLLSLGPALAEDDWGEWDDLPDNLLESQNDVRSLEDLSQQLDQLIADRAGASGSTQERLLERWLSQLAPDERESLSLDTLLSLPEDWTDDQFETWYESLGEDSGVNSIDDDLDDDEDDDDLDDDTELEDSGTDDDRDEEDDDDNE
ncbi:hypothetical protein [Saccharospirillum alexandrii]|uniref:hypothetical protein n=1 Tax=Saccharospirillum alexandrii TaxID=2448477 RepID=UPI0013E049E6|nr:hypothetical protein [Saccharospirillum alexandrii]